MKVAKRVHITDAETSLHNNSAPDIERAERTDFQPHKTHKSDRKPIVCSVAAGGAEKEETGQPTPHSDPRLRNPALRALLDKPCRRYRDTPCERQHFLKLKRYHPYGVLCVSSVLHSEEACWWHNCDQPAWRYASYTWNTAAQRTDMHSLRYFERAQSGTTAYLVRQYAMRFVATAHCRQRSHQFLGFL